MNISSFWPGWMRPERNNSSSMMYGDAEPVLPLVVRFVNQRSRGMSRPARARLSSVGWMK